MGGPDVTDRIAVGLQPSRRQQCGRILQIVSQRLQARRERGVVEREPRRVLHHPQRFAGAVEVGIEDSGDAPHLTP